MNIKLLPALCCLVAMPAAMPAQPQVVGKIAAKVGSQIITSYEIDQQAKLMEASMSPADMASAEGKKRMSDDRAKILDSAIEEKLVILAAEKGPEGYKEAADKGTAPANPYLPTALEVDEELDKAFDEARGHFPSQDVFEQELRSERISVSEFRSSLRERIRAQMTVKRMISAKEKEFQPSMRVSDEEARAFYDDHKSDFAVGQQVNLRHIQFKLNAYAKAEAAVQQLKASRNLLPDFIALAKKESQDDLTADKGGRLGWIEKGGLRWKAVEEAAFALKPGGIAGPIKSEDGLHVILVEDTKPGEEKSYDDVKNQVMNVVYQQKKEKRINDWVEDLKREFYVERNDS